MVLCFGRRRETAKNTEKTVGGLMEIPERKKKKPERNCVQVFGDPYGNRTHVTAVKGRCLNRLTNGPYGSGNLTRTDDTPGMNRMLYQLSYAAVFFCRSPQEHGYYTQQSYICQQVFSDFFILFLGGENRCKNWEFLHTTNEVIGVLQELIIMVLGGGGYVLVELLWRGYSHISMFLLGGLCFWIIGRLDHWVSMSVAVQACLGACVVTVLELLTGLVVNRWLKLDVWDYSSLPLNFQGQICLYYALLWIPLAAAAVFLEDGLRRILFGVPLPRYRLL